MREAQKKFLGVALVASSISGIVAPSVVAMATVIEDEEKATPDQLKSVINEYSVKLDKNPIFANYHRVLYAAERLAQYDEQYSKDTLSSIAKYDSKVYTKDIVKLVDKMNEFSMSKEMKIYDELVNDDIPSFAKIDKESADYLLGRLDAWGNGIVFEVDKNYSKATDEIVKVNTLREKDKLEEALDQVEVAKKAIKNIVTYKINGEYLEGKLKIEENKVKDDMAERDLYVRKVTVNNGREIEVKFNKSVSQSSAEDTENYSFNSANSSSKDIGIEEAELQDDDCTVILKIKSGLNTNSDAKHMVSIEKVMTNDGTEMKDYYEILNLYDDVAPEVDNIKYIDDNRIRINFSEPINIEEDDLSASVKIKLDGAKVNISKKAFKLDDDKKYIQIDLSKTGIDRNNKRYTIEIDGVSDYAGNSLEKYKDDLLVKKDNEDPEVTEIKALSKNDFRVEFNEKIYNDKFRVIVDGKEITLTKGSNLKIVDEDEDDMVEAKYDITLPTSTSEGRKLITVYDYKDLYENEGDSATEEVYFEAQHPVLEDTTPKLKTTKDRRYQVFTFDRDVNVGENEKDRLIEVKHVDSDGVTKTDKDIKLVDEDNNDADLESNEIALDITKLEEGKYTFDFETRNVVDHYGQKIEKVSLKFNNNTNDKTGKVLDVIPNDPKEQPDESDKQKALNKVIVEFDKEVGEDAKNERKYTIDNRQVFEKAVFVDDKMHVELTLKKDALSNTGKKTFRAEGIKNVKDYDKKLEFKDNTKPEVTRAEKTGLNTIKLIMSEEIKKGVTINKDDIKVKVEGNTLENDIKVTGQGTDVLIITLSKEDTLRSSRDEVTLEILDDNRISDEAGNIVESGIIDDVEVNLDDMLVTAINKVEVLKDACAKDLSDSKNLEDAKKSRQDAQNAVNDLKNSPDKTNLQNDIDEQSKIIDAKDTGNKLDEAIKNIGEVTIDNKNNTKNLTEILEEKANNETTVSSINSVDTKLEGVVAKDGKITPPATENKSGEVNVTLKNGDTTKTVTVKVIVNETTVPTIGNEATYKDGVITIKASEALSPLQEGDIVVDATNVGDFKDNPAVLDKEDYTVTLNKEDNSKINVTLKQSGLDKLKPSDNCKVKVIVQNTVKDLAGNTLKENKEVIVNIKDETAPILKEIKCVDANNVEIKFSESLDKTKFEGEGLKGFSAKNSGETEELITKVEISDDGLTVTLTGSKFEAGKTTVSYTKGTVSDKAGNQLDSFQQSIK
ncbi:Ig-like domain-containing protein [Clostridium frigidicarnis]|uniref:SbsA Ig-like domain-containing protein n=1 Tax=Clostridium frigidicarnis TaxID=84698 RepID=A0A1I0VXR4_9CLOT|nr:Ig-like domain-containing protein [Clostridium frigidicarnis]SFA81215.1 hypothetical protein SAMN04488528_1003114 [Clostridium frigidicarnis]